MTMLLLGGVRDALDTRLATTSGLYALRYNGTVPVTPAPSVGYVETEFVPATTEAITLGPASEVERTGLYIVRLYSPTGGGAALDALADTTLAVFPRGLALSAADSTVIRIRTDIAPFRGALTAATAGRSAVLLTIPWRTRTVD